MVLAVPTKEAFEQQLAQAGGKLVVVDFFATWCGPCKVIAPQVEALEKEMPGVIFLKVDVDECEDVAMQYKVSAMPTFMFFKNGEKLSDFAGANLQKLKDTIAKHQ